MDHRDAKLEKIDKAYDSPSWFYDVRGFFILTLTYRDTLWHQVGVFSRNISLNHLEVAMGSGTLLKIIVDYCKLTRKPIGKIYGFDYAERMLIGARKRFKHSPNVEVFRGDASALNYADNTFDSANIANAFHCFPEAEACMRELHRVLKPGASMLVNVLLYPPEYGFMAGIARRINNWGIKKGILYTPYSAEQARILVKQAGFEIVDDQIAGYALYLWMKKPDVVA